ncbi:MULTISPECIES: universal stress protein [Halolamina]|uniref:Universal stress protein family protein n=1 Tax=Halolamina pelagica TaxID=699431 RepID=A0A1I5SDF2_9EURY|nr:MULTISPECIES: universal stress protein [Halolamina]NHX37110.1 universal stress protein [Halolamina sp. R1-12]SFP68755.1 Universal stress protein family protein [Halolamina pelagica]
MTLLVPFDGSALAEAALIRAVEFGEVFEQPVVAIAVLPEENAAYARERGWIEPDESFDTGRILSRLREQVRDRAPEATFRYERVPRVARAGSIAREIRRTARRIEASIVFVGSDNAGRLVTALSSVGGNVAADRTYDVLIVRHTG